MLSRFEVFRLCIEVFVSFLIVRGWMEVTGCKGLSFKYWGGGYYEGIWVSFVFRFGIVAGIWRFGGVLVLLCFLAGI